MTISDFTNWKRTRFSCKKKNEFCEQDGSRYIFTHTCQSFYRDI